MNKRTTPPKLNREVPKKRTTFPKITPEILTIIVGIIVCLLILLLVFKFGRTEANLWFNGGFK